jgi:hypothetical protein
MRFTVPQFIEMEPKIVGPFTFKQFIFIGIAGAICFLLYFSIGKTNFFLFLLISLVLILGALALAFLKIGGRPLPTILGNSLKFLISRKLYIWKKEEFKIEVFKKEEKLKRIEEKADELPLKIAKESQLKKIRTQIETQTR